MGFNPDDLWCRQFRPPGARVGKMHTPEILVGPAPLQLRQRVDLCARVEAGG
jgi:hypothetical protein